MSTPYVFSDELPALSSVAAADIVLIWDTSAGRMKRSTVSQAQAVVLPLIVGGAQASVVGWYGETGVNQGTMAAAAVTALATAVISAGKAAAVWGWASSTEAKAFVSRAAQAQADLETLMTKLDAVGLVSVAGV
jgi:hypothetical protein